MPRVNGVFQLPPGTYGAPGGTIESAKYNIVMDDLAADLNVARPITAGGTGATTATQARTNLGLGNVTNTSDANKPVSTAQQAALDLKLAKAGDAMTGNLTIANVSPAINLNETDDPRKWRIGVGTGDLHIARDETGDGTYDTPHAFSLFPSTADATIWGQRVWTSGNDGVGSGLNADLLDGLDATAFYRTNAAHSTSGNLTISNTSPTVTLTETDDPKKWRIIVNTGDFYIQRDETGDGSYDSPHPLLLHHTGTFAEIWGQRVWTAGNDGAGSGLDADLLDGFQAAAFYRTDAPHSTTGNLTITNGAPQIKLLDTTSGQYSGRLRVDANNVYLDSSTDDVTFAEVFRFELDAKIGYVAGERIWTAGNDGAGSGLDADFLDGQQGAWYRDLANSTGTLPNARFSGTYDGITQIGTARLRLTATNDASETSTGHAFQLGADAGQNVVMDTNEMMVRNNGALATDTFSFRHGGAFGFAAPGGVSMNGPLSTGGTFYAAGAATFNSSVNAAGSFTAAGGYTANGGFLTLSSAAPQIKLIDTTSGQYSARLRVDANNVYFDSSPDDTTFGEVFRFELDTKKGFVAGSVILTDANTTASYINGKIGYTPASNARLVTAGNGLTGGGNLTADRTLALGTPGDITNSTSNAVSATSHTHALGFIAAEVHTGTVDHTTIFPMGHQIMMYSGSSVARNSNVTPTLRTDDVQRYVLNTDGRAGTALAGTWRARGYTDNNFYLVQRVA